MTKKSSRKSRFTHFAAPVGGLFAAVAVIFLLNAQYYAAQIMLHFNSPKNTSSVTQAAAQTENKQEQAKKVAPEPKVIIPGINVDAPVIYGMTSTVERDIQRALQDGVLHFADTPKPGQPGNGVYVGHSSNVPWAPGNFKFVFTALENVTADEVFYLNYEGKQYVYKVISKRVVNPRDVSVMNGTNKPTATLITCTPVGTNTNRLVLLGEQIHPAPTTGVAKKPATQSTVLPGN